MVDLTPLRNLVRPAENPERRQLRAAMARAQRESLRLARDLENARRRQQVVVEVDREKLRDLVPR